MPWLNKASSQRSARVALRYVKTTQVECLGMRCQGPRRRETGTEMPWVFVPVGSPPQAIRF